MIEETSKIWDKKWCQLELQSFIEKCFETDNWTIAHKPIIDRLLKNVTKDAIFLEAGCGMGQWCLYVAKNYNIKSVGVDITEQNITRLKEVCKEIPLIDFILDDLNDTKLPPNFFDIFISLGVIEHFKNSIPMLNSLFRLLKTNGIGLVTVPNIYSIHSFTRPILKIFRKWDIGYEKSFSPYTLRKQLEKVGFTVVESGVLPSGEFFGSFLNTLPLIGNIFIRISKWLERKQNILGFISFAIVKK